MFPDSLQMFYFSSLGHTTRDQAFCSLQLPVSIIAALMR